MVFYGSLSIIEQEAAVYQQAFISQHFDVQHPKGLDGEVDEFVGRNSFAFRESQDGKLKSLCIHILIT